VGEKRVEVSGSSTNGFADIVIDDAERHGEHAELLSVLCECGDVGLHREGIDVPLATYEWIRSASATLRGSSRAHELADSERIIRRRRRRT